MSKKLAAKAGLIQMPPVGQAATAATKPEAVDGKPKTAPGAMLTFMNSQSAAVKEAEDLRQRLRDFEGALPVRPLDPKLVKASRWANRHEANFDGEEFARLKAEIASAGGNVQPIKVRATVGQDSEAYEIVYGHRRHRACLELGLPVLALIEEVSEQQLFVQMERENRQRKDLSAWEQGQMYARALDEGLYPSNRQLAGAIGRDLGDVGKALALARLPRAVVEAFASPLDLQFRWAKPLGDAQQADPEGLLQRAKAVKLNASKLNPRQILEQLLRREQRVGPSNPSNEIAISASGKTVAILRTDAKGRALITFEADALPGERRAELARIIGNFLAKP
jgi:ParB family chromosome partitioning protein